MLLLNRRALLAGMAATPLAGVAASAEEFYPIPVELLGGFNALQGKVTLGNPDADVALVEFFDYNCPYCKGAAKDIRPLLGANKDLAFVLVNYAVLGIPSIGATRVALAFSRQKPERYLEFHEQLFSTRGTIGPDHAIAVALRLGAKKAQLLEDADSESVTRAMSSAAKLGNEFGMRATPSYLIGRDAFAGFLTKRQKQAAIDAYRKCERAVCA
ncbi:MAG TPA: thioredoxin domain-containing protein [Rhabdaerophilum sp.]|nr:thioredoxin domain-containing protein [Rhabdaerophilum sp.]